MVHLPGDEDLPFEVDPFARPMLLDGTDELGYLLGRGRRDRRLGGGHPARVDTRVRRLGLTASPGGPFGHPSA